MRGDIDGSGRIKHSLRSDIINAALESTLIVCLYPSESLAVIQMLHQTVEQGHAIKSSQGCLGLQKCVRMSCYKNTAFSPNALRLLYQC